MDQLPTDKPAARSFAAMVHDRFTDKTFLYGGLGSGGDWLDETWVWNGSNWANVTPAGASPGSRMAAAMAFDWARDRTLLFSGFSDGSLNDTWEWDGAAWVQMTPLHSPPPRAYHALVYDVDHNQTILFGGVSGGVFLGDTWAWDGTDWTELHPAHTPPGRYGHVMTYDLERRCIVLFGGTNNAGLNDTWEWDGADWIQQTPANSPSARTFASLAFDETRKRAVLFGGSGMTPNTVLNDTWEWDGANWQQQTPANSPAARWTQSMVFDWRHGRTVLFGGSSSSTKFDDTWHYGDAALDADVSLETTGPATAQRGQNITYSFAVANAGPAAAKVTLITGYVRNTTFVSVAAPDGWALTLPEVGGASGFYAEKTLEAGTTETLTMTVHINDSTAYGTGIIGRGYISTKTPDPDFNDQLSTTTTTITEPPSLVVNTIDDILAHDGKTSLREAIQYANEHPGPDTVSFNIPEAEGVDIDGGGTDGDAEADTWTIDLRANLPTLTDADTTIDGRTQSSFIGSDPNPKGLEIVLINGGDGLAVDGNDCTIRNLVIQWMENGIKITGDHNKVAGCYIGTDATATENYINVEGILIEGGSNNVIGGVTVADRNIVGFNDDGISVEGETATGNIIQGNYIGVAPDGVTPLPNTVGIDLYESQATQVGGTHEEERNLVGAGRWLQIWMVNTYDNVIEGNYLNTDKTGNTAMGFLEDHYCDDEILIEGDSSGNRIGGIQPGAGNIMAGGDWSAIEIDDLTNNTIAGNNIGVGADGVTLLNTGYTRSYGITISGAFGNTIGGTGNAGNRIAGYNEDGIRIIDTAPYTAFGNSISGNSIYGNGGLGINLINDEDGDSTPTANDAGDADEGPNALQNYPVLSQATTTDGVTTIEGTLDSATGATYRIEFFANTTASSSGFGEGQTYLGALTAFAPNTPFTFSTNLPAGQKYITATATNETSQDTSEFSAAVQPTNQSPRNTVPGSQSTNEDTPWVFAAAHNNRITIADPDAAANPMQVTVSITNGTLTLASTTNLNFTAGDGADDNTMTFTGSTTDINNAFNGLSYAPLADYYGVATLTLTTNDQGYSGLGGAQQDIDTITIDVQSVNDAPAFTFGQSQSVGEDAGTQTVPEFATAMSAGPANESTQALDFLVTNDNRALFANQPAINSDGELTYTPASNASGMATVTVRLHDDGGTSNNGEDTSAPQAFTITVNATNDAPVAQNQSVGIAEDTPLSITLAASDVDNVNLAYSIVGQPQHGALSGTGANLIYAPSPDYNGQDYFTFKANDGALESNVATVNITIGGNNDAPVAVADTVSTDEDTPVDFDVLHNDRDVENNTLQVARIAVTTAAHGVVTVNPNGMLRYVPDANYNGPATFTYTVSDGTLESTATVGITVNAVNDAPVAVADSYDVSSASLSITAPGVLSDDSDVDSATLTASLDANPAHGGVILNADGSFTYTPQSGFSGTDTFTYTVSDGVLSANGVVTLHVTAVTVQPTPTPTLPPDRLAPSIFFASPRNGSRSAAFPAINGMAHDRADSTGPAGSDIVKVLLTLRRALDGRYWSGRAWVTTPTNLTASLGGTPTAHTFRYTGASPSGLNVMAGVYYLSTVAFDGAGNRGQQTVSFRVLDIVAPLVTITSPPNGTTLNRLPQLEGTLTDEATGTGPAFTILQVRRSSDGFYWNGVRWMQSPAALRTTLSGRGSRLTWQAASPAPLAPSSGRDLYYITALGYDRSGNRGVATAAVTKVGATSPGSVVASISRVGLSTATADTAKRSVQLSFDGRIAADSLMTDNFVVTVNEETTTIERIVYDSATSTVTLVLAENELQPADKVQVAWNRLADEQAGLVRGKTTITVH